MLPSAFHFCTWNIHIILISSIFLDLAQTREIHCLGTQCQNTFINCAPRENCHVYCSDSESCRGSVINCPLKGDCTVECDASNSCENAIIDATVTAGNFELICDKTNSNDHCRGVTVYGSTLSHNFYTFNISCNNNMRSCMNSEIHCPLNADCHLACNGHEACSYANIYGPDGTGSVDLHCNAERACFHTLIDGSHSSQLYIRDCTQYKSCFDLIIMCPPNTNGRKNCFLQGNNNLGIDQETPTPTLQPSVSPTLSPTSPTNTPTATPSISPTLSPTLQPTLHPILHEMIIYAVNGWNDLDIQYTGSYGNNHGGRMLCGSQYSVSCDLASKAWSCANDALCSTNFVGISATSTTKASIGPISADSISTSTSQPNPVDHPVTTEAVKHYSDPGESHPTEPYTVNQNDATKNTVQRDTGELMIIGGICFVLAVCVCVGWAQVSKECREKKLSHQQLASPPENVGDGLSEIERRRSSRSRASSRSQQQRKIPIKDEEDEPHIVALEGPKPYQPAPPPGQINVYEQHERLEQEQRLKNIQAQNPQNIVHVKDNVDNSVMGKLSIVIEDEEKKGLNQQYRRQQQQIYYSSK
mmetsp:Transcript_58840/g.93565  ORF Transcript_58840/g.93565 Transcript_58840/m.93565 type:complete len:586 (+) Transcript_58840:23-1780(+)